jgi:hypothetical protein
MATSIHQLAILEWLWRHPGLTLDRRGRWNGSWISDAAWDHMEETVTVLGGNPGKIGNRGKPYLTGEGTPRSRRPTFLALLRRGWVEVSEADKRRFVVSKAGLEAYLRLREKFRGQEPRGDQDRTKRPRKPGIGEIKRRGGAVAARNSMGYHRRMEAHHRRIAEHIEASLEVLEQQQDEWVAAHARTS